MIECSVYAYGIRMNGMCVCEGVRVGLCVFGCARVGGCKYVINLHVISIRNWLRIDVAAAAAVVVVVVVVRGE